MTIKYKPSKREDGGTNVCLSFEGHHIGTIFNATIRTSDAKFDKEHNIVDAMREGKIIATLWDATPEDNTDENKS